jgi:hypothetical protein
LSDELIKNEAELKYAIVDKVKELISQVKKTEGIEYPIYMENIYENIYENIEFFSKIP